MSDLVASITEHFNRDQERIGQPLRAGELPLQYEDLTIEWLNHALCANTPGVEVESFELGAIDNGSSNRRKIRVRYTQEDSGLPEKLFCKASHNLVNRISLGASGAALAEKIFYTDFRAKLNIEAPQCWYAEVDTKSFNSLIMLGDVSDEVQEFCNHHTHIDLHRAQTQMSLLAEVHGPCYSDAELRGSLSKFLSWREYFEGTVAFGMDSGSNNGFLAAEEVIPPRLYRRFKEIWPATVASVLMHDSLPNTLAHGDVHLKNWYVAGPGHMGLADWQCCNRGHWSRDIAYTISTALSIEDRRQWEKQLIEQYLDELKSKGGASVTFDQAWDLYRSQLVAALAWWTFTLTPPPGLPDMQPRDITLDFIGRIATAIDDLDALDVAGAQG